MHRATYSSAVTVSVSFMRQILIDINLFGILKMPRNDQGNVPETVCILFFFFGGMKSFFSIREGGRRDEAEMRYIVTVEWF